VLEEIAIRHQERYSTVDPDRSTVVAVPARSGHGERPQDLRRRRAELEAQLRPEAAAGEAARPLATGPLARAIGPAWSG
jgi:hypothetical protein